MIRIYNLLISIISWSVLLPWQLIQVVGRRNSLQEITERLGHAQMPERGGEKRIVIHAVSVGELMAAAAMLDEIAKQDSLAEVVLATGNRDGRAVAEKLQARYPLVKHVSFLPWDRASAMQSWLSRLAPDVVAVVETEIWPSFFYACRELKIPLCIVNGRIYERDFSRYRLLRGFFQCVLACVDWIGVIDEQESERFIGIGAKVENVWVVGDMKCDAAFLEAVEQKPPLKKGESGQLLLVAGSTHPPEEIAILRVFRRLKNCHQGLKVVLAPRHLRRADSIEREARHLGFEVARFSNLSSSRNAWDVLVLDKMGKLAELYALADLVLIGGSFSAHGGHNFLEAAVHARPILIGPDTRSFKGLADYFLENGGLVRVSSVSALETSVQELLEDEKRRTELGQKAYELLQLRRGAAQRYVDTALKLAQSHRTAPRAQLTDRVSVYSRKKVQ